MPPTTPATAVLQPEHDAAARLWTAVQHAHERFAVNRRELGKLFFQLKNLYSERANSAARRLTSGHGVFQMEIKKRGYPPHRSGPMCSRRYCGYWRECEREFGGRVAE